MKTFQVRKDNFEQELKFEDLAAAEAYWNYLQPCTIQEVPTIVKTDAEKLADRQTFGIDLRDKYLLDNDAIVEARGYPMTLEESNQQAAKFSTVMAVLPIGSLRQSLAIISATATDVIFTQERKDAYILLLTEFIAAQ
jgi:hypothetical protein